MLQNTFLNAGNETRDPLLQVLQQSQQYNVRISSIDGRVLKDVRGNTLYDFASCNYLGLDLDQDKLIPAGVQAAKSFGMHTSRARLMGYHELFTQLENRLAKFIGCEDTLLFPNTTLASIGIIPALIRKDDLIILDKSAHATMYQAAQMARDKGAILRSFPQGDMVTLQKILQEQENCPRKIICVDGVYSMTGDYADLTQLIPIAEKHRALLYIDDGHGFALIGEKENSQCSYGSKGNGVINHYGVKSDCTMYVAGTAKGLAAGAAFVEVTPEMKEFLMAYAKPLDYTHPSTPFCLGVLDAALDLLTIVGDSRRITVHDLSTKLISGLRDMGFYVMNSSNFPIISVWAGDTGTLIEASRYLYQHGIFLTSCPYPTMPKGKEALRITVTALNTDEQIDHLLTLFSEIKRQWQNKGIAISPDMQR
ncbi:8-amino-7-oxononanoate synthase [Erwinia toletana]|uniref:8-amino-7-oxononanoate synthase n=2 Tax=Winslowiella toletana TaxID=92490 RepID=A0ABS4P9W3_9GAMM|nr:pyridoxal phosphate-dependent aminotransferase family protein [Winslowiella toletana]MBP2169419.1 8-amino-7-oxononanoate synthase [Winslowiella toletana]